SPSGLLYISTRGGSVSALATKLRPSSSIRSPPRTLIPTWATSPLTRTRPSAIRCSSARREPSPACASTLCNRSSSRGATGAVSPRFRVSLRLPLLFSSLILLLRRGRCGVVIVDLLRLWLVGGGRAVVAIGRRDLRVEAELRLELADVLDLGQRRQVFQALQPEVVEEGLGRGQQFRLAGNVAMADDADPFALLERLDDVAVHGHAADLLDLAAGDRLAIGDQRQRLQGRARISGRALGPQPRHPGMDVGLDLVAEARCQLDQLDAASGAILAQLLQRLLDAAVGCRLVEREQRVQLGQAQRLVRGQQRGLHDPGDKGLVEGR